MSEKLQGTIIIDGLIEGRLPPFDDAETRLRQWVSKARSRGLLLSLEIDGARFSVLSDNKPISAAALGQNAVDTVTDVLSDLMVIFPPPMRSALVSSIRSIEYGQNVEIQTGYAVDGLGRIETQQRTADAQTTAPAEPLTKRQILKLAAAGLVLAGAIFGISAIFVDYGDLFTSISERSANLDPDAVSISTGSFADYFTIEKRTVADKKRLVLTVKRTKAYPLTDQACTDLSAEAGNSDPKTLTAQALARGYIRCEMFDKKDTFIGYAEGRIVDLRTKETVTIALPLFVEHRLARVKITY